jgi:hypothetical protein
MNDDVELYGLKAKSNKFLRRRIIRPLDDSIVNEATDVAETHDVTNDILTDVPVVIATTIVKAPYNSYYG